MLEAVSPGCYCLHGDIDMQESSVLLKELLALPRTAPVPVLSLDLSSLGMADSLLLAALLELGRQQAGRGGKLRVKGLSASMRGLARTYGIDTLLDTLLET